MKTLRLIVALLVVCVAGGAAEAAPGKIRRYGIVLSIQGDPFPSSYGLNLVYNLSRVIALQAGYGLVFGSSDASVTGAGVRLKWPKWRFQPFVGATWARVSNADITYSSPLDGDAEYSLPQDQAHFYGTVGLSVSTNSGLYFAGGYNRSFSAGQSGLLFFHLGKFF